MFVPYASQVWLRSPDPLCGIIVQEYGSHKTYFDLRGPRRVQSVLRTLEFVAIPGGFKHSIGSQTTEDPVSDSHDDLNSTVDIAIAFECVC